MIKKPLPNDNPKRAYRERGRDRIHRFLMAGDTIRGYLVHGTRMVREMQENHGTGPLETHLLGQAAMGSALMAANLKDTGRIHIQWECGGPLKGITVEADTFGAVRGYLHRNPIPPEEIPEGSDLSALFGPGFLTVTRKEEAKKEPRTSVVMLKHGSIPRDLTVFHHESEQAATAMALDIRIDDDGNASGAGGLFLQALPEAPEEVLRALETTVDHLPPLGQSFSEGRDPEVLLLELFATHAPRFLESLRIEFFCPCDRKLFLGYLRGLNAADRREIREEGPFPLEITCHNCSTIYTFPEDEVKRVLV